MAEQMEFICVTCPVGCTIQATVEGQQLIAIQGQACKRGEPFVREELTAPRRMLTTTVPVRGGRLPLLPVHSSAPLPKALLLPVAALMRQVQVDAPVEEGQVIAPNVLESGVDMVASRPLLAVG
jgi:CxxC motif-containing protein